MASDNKVVSDVKLQKIVDKLRAIKDRQQLGNWLMLTSPFPRRSSPFDFFEKHPCFLIPF